IPNRSHERLWGIRQKPTPRRGQTSQAQSLGATPMPRHPLIIQDPRLGARAK
ncbi:hypothetical protein PIB30_105676, partial [Stylosanthes scabra]|nr:hypothetical protein [Stylosanthes scabra]